LIGLALALNPGATAQDRDRDGMQLHIAYKHGYRAGYADGYNAGKNDYADRMGRDYQRHTLYQEADRGYESRFGRMVDYKEGYSLGFEVGYFDGYVGRAYDSRLPPNVAHPDRKITPVISQSDRERRAPQPLIFPLALTASAQRQQGEIVATGREVTILVTAHPHNDRAREIAARLRPDDFVVLEEKRKQPIVSVKRASEAPPIVAVLIQDDLVSRVNNEIAGVRDFIRQLPEGSRVMTGYITAGALRVTQDFTSNLACAADSLRIIAGSGSVAPFNPFVEVIEALRRFDAQPQGRRIVLLVSDGLDVSRGFRGGSPLFSLDLDRAISEAQRRGVAVFSFYAPAAGLTSWNRLAANYGQGSLNRLADETGGVAFFSGTSFVTFDPYFKELNELLGLQWLITYRSSNTGAGFRRIEVTTDYDLHLHHPAGYRARDNEGGER
jgi:VWFA-related protein